MLRVLVLAAVALAAACTKPLPVAKQPFPSMDPDAPRAAPAPAANGAPATEAANAAAPAKPEPEPKDVASLDAVAYAKRHPRPEFCEEAARRLQRSSRGKAWEVLKACVAKGKFTVLSRLVDGAWTEDLRTRPEASKLIARVIAARGGDVTGDLGQMRQQRIPLFPLGPAMSHPDLYKGRLVLLRGEVRDVKLASGKATARLAEFAIGNSETYVAEGNRSARRSAGSASYGNSDGYSSSREGSSVTVWQRERRLTSNVPVETGLELVARMGEIDPFFEPGRQFVVLARFDGVREEDTEELEEQGTKVALVSVVAYYEPSASIVE